MKLEKIRLHKIAVDKIYSAELEKANIIAKKKTLKEIRDKKIQDFLGIKGKKLLVSKFNEIIDGVDEPLLNKLSENERILMAMKVGDKIITDFYNNANKKTRHAINIAKRFYKKVGIIKGKTNGKNIYKV